MVTRAGHLRLRRASERGTAVFIVVLVITLLTGIGVFAARSTSLATASSGNERQMTQTQYVTDYAVLAVTSELSTDKRDAYIKTMATTPDTGCKAQAALLNKTCYRFGYEDLEKQLGNSNTFMVKADTANLKPGSLGPAELTADFQAEMTDLGPATPPVAGTDLTSAGAAKVQFMAVTITATGQVRPTAVNVGIDQLAAATASIQSSRAHIIVGPLPKL